jgi:hypothetical protein
MRPGEVFRLGAVLACGVVAIGSIPGIHREYWGLAAR